MLDELDLKIMGELHKDGRISITELADRVGASRPTVTKRFNRLLEDKSAIIQSGLDPKAFGFKIACFGLEVKNEGTRIELEKMLESCPRVLNVFRTPEKANLHIGVWGEEDQTINSTVESFRDFPEVDVIYVHYLGTPIYGGMAINIPPVTSEEPPCGKDCSGCHRYQKNWCCGCPQSNYYRNPILG
ncbi:MAG: AsnC family transcriptional regulator [Candidatus Bathyarchaeota archaeon]|jgi:DNA-binding Lrp family transcriptional regulator